jgi:hypothetical protein
LGCVYYHSNTIFDKLLLNGQCPQPKTCLSRHPRDCKHWTGDKRGCLKGNLCKYLHNSRGKSIEIKTKKNNHEHESECQNITIDKEIDTEGIDDDLKEIIEARDIVIKEMDEEVVSDEKYDSLKEAIEAKEILIMKKDKEIEKLRLKNESLVENNNKVKRIAWNMDQEIKVLRSKLN